MIIWNSGITKRNVWMIMMISNVMQRRPRRRRRKLTNTHTHTQGNNKWGRDLYHLLRDSIVSFFFFFNIFERIPCFLVLLQQSINRMDICAKKKSISVYFFYTRFNKKNKIHIHINLVFVWWNKKKIFAFIVHSLSFQNGCEWKKNMNLMNSY